MAECVEAEKAAVETVEEKTVKGTVTVVVFLLGIVGPFKILYLLIGMYAAYNCAAYEM